MARLYWLDVDIRIPIELSSLTCAISSCLSGYYGVPESAEPIKEDQPTSRAVTTPTSHPVSMIFRNYNTNPEIGVRRRW